MDMTDGAAPPRFVRHVPNALSAMRLALAIGLPFAPAPWRLPIVIVAGLSDGLDGFVARRFHATSSTGAVLDALSDKLFTLSAIVTLAMAGEIASWMAALAWSRDFAVLVCVLVAIVRRDYHEIMAARPSHFGKWTTAFFFLWFVVELLPGPPWAQWAAFILAAGLSALTAIEYFVKLAAGLKERKASTPDQ